jgi:multicomponent Na+:H+ antiporter subunit G
MTLLGTLITLLAIGLACIAFGEDWGWGWILRLLLLVILLLITLPLASHAVARAALQESPDKGGEERE